MGESKREVIKLTIMALMRVATLSSRATLSWARLRAACSSWTDLCSIGRGTGGAGGSGDAGRVAVFFNWPRILEIVRRPNYKGMS